MKLLIINGPNLNFLKIREKIYFKNSFKKIKKIIKNYSRNLFPIFYNSNCEGKIINFIQKNINVNYIIINPGAFSHYSISILDNLKSFKGKIIEIHLTNIYKREYFRKNSIISLKSNIIISGAGIKGYLLALNYILIKS